MQTTVRPPKLAPERNGPRAGADAGGPLSSKNGSVAAALVTAALAGLIIVFFLDQYRDSVKKDGVPTPVLVAQQLIEQGASGDAAGAEGLFKTARVARDQVKAGAVADAATLRGKVAVADILPGQQLTAADFRLAGQSLVTKLGADQRAMSVSLDSAHGLLGKIRAGDRVDVLSGFLLDNAVGRQNAVLRVLLQDVLVLGAPKPAGSGIGQNAANQTAEVTLRVRANAAPKLAFAADNGKLWLVLRPQNGATLDRATIVSMASVLAGARPIDVRAGRRPR